MEAQVFELKTPRLKKGRSHKVLARTGLMNIALKCYSEGGENTLHTHPGEDHAFLILDGEATFYDKDGKTTVVKKGQGIMLPEGYYYWFNNTGGKPLMFLRFGASREKPEITRIGVDRKSLPGSSVENKHVDPVLMEGTDWTL